MKILKLTMRGLPNFKEELCIDFVAKQRVDEKDMEQLHRAFSNIYTNPVLAFIGINASGKTTILKAVSFAIELLGSQPLNNICVKEILDDLGVQQTVLFTSYFYHDDTIFKLETLIKKMPAVLDAGERLIIEDETLWEKKIQKVKTKKGIFDFNTSDLFIKRDRNEKFLPSDVSIMIALNKQLDTKFFLYDMSNLTDYNILNALGNYPREILTFFDPSIEFLNCRKDGKEVDIQLKFGGKEEIRLKHPEELNRYLSSGTIKGLGVFIRAFLAFWEGGYLIVDELENHFNKEIVATLIRFFLDKRVNKNGGTLIFSTHYSELLDHFDRNDMIYIVKNVQGIGAANLSGLLKRNDVKKSEVYDSDFLEGTVPEYETYIALKKVLMTSEVRKEL